MKAVAATVFGVFSVLLFGVFGLISLVVIAAGGAGSTSVAVTVSNPSEQALEDIPPLLLQLFITEAQQCAGLPWTVIAGISKVESDHGRFGGAVLGSDGVIQPSIVGIPLDGGNGTARIADTDDGRWDGDSVWDRAVGPFQFIPGSWRLFGGDGDGDGVADPNNVFDAVPALRRHVCPDGQIVDIDAAVFSYNRSHAYVDVVLDWAVRYTGPLATSAIPMAGYALPIPIALASEASLSRSHHDYGALDLGIPVGTPVFAMVAGTISTATRAGTFPSDPRRCGSSVVIAGVDGASYTYCHLSRLAVVPGQVVGAGTPIALSGGQPGAAGAGNTTGPHLHLGIRFQGAAVCPQPLLLAIYRSRPVNPAIAPAVGCVQGRPTTDWGKWLDQIQPIDQPTQGVTP